MRKAQTSKTETLVSTLKTSQDFTELLSLSELSTQLEVLSFLQSNLFEYQMNYLKNHLMTFDEMMAYIPENEKKIYFKEYTDYKLNKAYKKVYKRYSEEYLREKLKYRYWKRSKPAYFDYVKTHYFLVNTVDKTFYHFNKALVPKFKFSSNKNILICTYTRSRKTISYGKFCQASQWDEVRTIEVYFNMKTNLLVGLNDNTRCINPVNVGSWFENGYGDDKEEKEYDD